VGASSPTIHKGGIMKKISECYSGSMEPEEQAFFDELDDGLPKNDDVVKAKMIEAWEIEKNYLVNSGQQEHILSFEDWSESLTDADIEEILKDKEGIMNYDELRIEWLEEKNYLVNSGQQEDILDFQDWLYETNELYRSEVLKDALQMRIDELKGGIKNEKK
jgi:hypothetical protein